MEEHTLNRDEAIDDELIQIEIPMELAEFLSKGEVPREADGVQRFCRICLHAFDCQIMTCVFTGAASDEQLAVMLSTFTRLQLVTGDGMPSKVCHSCKELIIQSYMFKQKCERSDTALRAFLQGNVIYNVKSEIGDSINVKFEMGEDTGFCIQNQIEDSNDCYSGFDAIETIKPEIKQEIKTEEEVPTDKCNLGAMDLLRIKKKSKSKKNNDHTQNGLKSEKKLQKKLKFYCDECNKSFKDIEKLSQHIEAHMLHKMGKCETCGKNCKSERGLRQHVFLAHGGSDSAGERPFICLKCESSFVSSKDLMIHSAVHSDNSLICYECKKQFQTMLQLKRHIKRHMDEKPHKCQICFKTFSEISALYRHQRSHFGTAVEKKHVCTVCNKKFAEKSALTVHMRQHTGERPYICVKCGKDFLSVRLLNSHMRTHSDHKPYKCKQCDKSFRHTTSLATHRRTHTGERPYVCSVCGKTFIQSSNLTLHKRVHSGERPYGCSTCGKHFTSWSTMKAHERIHTGEKPYSCKICGQRFARTDMKAHMRRHTGEKPYTCTLCDKSFFTSVRLSEHSRLHSGIKPYECGLCSLKLVTKSSLLKHMKKHRLGNVNKVNKMQKSKPYNVLSIEFAQNDSTEGNALQICDYIGGTETVIEQDGEIKSQERHMSMIIPELTEELPVSVDVEMSRKSSTADQPNGTVTPRGRRLSVFHIRSAGSHIIMNKDCSEPEHDIKQIVLD